MSKNAILRGTAVLTITGFITRFIGFFFRMFLSHTFGEEQVGLYQLIFPIYALCISLTTAGIETALSRCVAQKVANNRKKEADSILYQALFLSLALSFILSFFLRKYAGVLAIYVLGDLRCESLLTILSYMLPFSSIHCCICGYYFGQQQTKIPSISQFVEQLTRVGAVYLIYQLTKDSVASVSIRIAVFGLVIGEAMAAAFCIRCVANRSRIRLSLSSLRHHYDRNKELVSLAIPLTSSRVLMNLLQSVESISIPLCLQAYGHSNSEALITYGVLTGMALPLILFPTAVTGSVATMMLPTAAELQAKGNKGDLKQMIQKVSGYGLLLGSVYGCIFLIAGSKIGEYLFGSALAGDFIKTLAWMCPFLYINNILISILNGLGHAKSTFFINLCGLFLRICGVWFGIPTFGMNGYLRGLLISQLIISSLCILELYRTLKKRASN